MSITRLTHYLFARAHARFKRPPQLVDGIWLASYQSNCRYSRALIEIY
jgi:hypothetical protein